MSDLYDRIAKLEGYYPKPYWDVKQWSVGHGTRASGPNDVVDAAEARRRLQAEVDYARGYVTKVGSHLDPGTQDALTSLTYNVGPKAITGPTGLAAAVRSGDTAEIRRIMMQYTKADGRTLPGLVNRRRAEVGWIGQGLPGPRLAGAQSSDPVNDLLARLDQEGGRPGSQSGPATSQDDPIGRLIEKTDDPIGRFLDRSSSVEQTKPNILASGYGRESGPGQPMPPMPEQSYASAAPPAPPAPPAPMEQSWLGKALGLSPSVNKGVTGAAGAIAGAFGKSQGDDGQRLAAERDAVAKASYAALSEDEQRQQAALKAVLGRRQRSAFA